MSAVAYTYMFHRPIPNNPKTHLSSSHFVILQNQFIIKMKPSLFHHVIG